MKIFYLIVLLAFACNVYADKDKAQRRNKKLEETLSKREAQKQEVENLEEKVNEELAVETIDKKEEEAVEEEEYKPKWSFSHKHHRISKQETPEQAANRHWKQMDVGNKKKMLEALEKFKEAKEKNDHGLRREAVESLEQVGKDASEMGDKSTAQFIPSLIAELDKVAFEPESSESESAKTEGDEEFLADSEYEKSQSLESNLAV